MFQQIRDGAKGLMNKMKKSPTAKHQQPQVAPHYYDEIPSPSSPRELA